jgi:hypothetical protein
MNACLASLLPASDGLQAATAVREHKPSHPVSQPPPAVNVVGQAAEATKDILLSDLHG